jgi:hypothetical protein
MNLEDLSWIHYLINMLKFTKIEKTNIECLL